MTNRDHRQPDRSTRGCVAADPFAGRVLLVDDNPSIRTMAALFLRSLGWQVVEAKDGECAVGEALGTPFDLVLMDLNLPGVDGPEATRRIRAIPDGEASRVPIIGMTAANHDERRQDCLDAGMDDVIDKVSLMSAIPGLLRRFAGRTAAAVPDLRSPPPPPANDLEARDTDLGLGELNCRLDLIGRDEMARVFAGFSAQGTRHVAELGQAWREGRYGDAGAAAHRLAGGAATFQMIGVHGLLIRLETALRRPIVDGGEVSGLLDRVARAWPPSVAAFERWLAAGP